MCYSDIPFLYQLRGFADGWLPYLQTGPGRGPALEYPVLTGFFMQIGSWLTGHDGSAQDRALTFYDWNVILLFVCFLATVVFTALTVRRRPWDAALVALAPGVILCAVINWDLLAVALTAGAMLAWSRARLGWAGVLLGLAVAAKFYPLLLLGPLFLLCLRAGRLRAFWITTGWAAAAWTVVNLPVYLVNRDGWLEFYTFSSDPRRRLGIALVRPAGLGLPGAAGDAQHGGRRVAGPALPRRRGAHRVGPAAAAPRAGGVPRHRRVLPDEQGLLAAVRPVAHPARGDGPAALARLPRSGRPARSSTSPRSGTSCSSTARPTRACPRAGTSSRSSCTCSPRRTSRRWWCATSSCPRHDPVRSDGVPEHRDDPGGGVLDGAEDRWVLRHREPTVDVEPVLAGHLPAPDHLHD